MKFSVIEARAKRSQFDELAGDCYRDNSSQIIKDLNRQNKKSYFGIQNSKGMYTVIGEKSVYFSVEPGLESEILNSELLRVFQRNAMQVGKGGEFEFVNIAENESVWVLNGKVMCAMWNILMLLCEANGGESIAR
ncbi:MAG: hypothetical protein P8X74_05280 [Reinekea sp.]